MHITNVTISVFSGFAGVVIGAVITYVLQKRLLDKQLAEQGRIASERLRLDLFDRRYKVFKVTRKFLATILEKASFETRELAEFSLATSDAEFLFGRDIVD
jgi:hypothetical protein